MKRSVVTLACAAMLIVAMSSGQTIAEPNSPDQHQSKVNEAPSPRLATDLTQRKSVAGNAATKKSDKGSATKNREPTLGQLRDRAQPWLDFIAAGGAIAQACFALFAILAWLESRRSANTAEATFKLGQETAETQLRAYINLTGRVAIEFEDDLPRNVILRFINSGSTPARNVEVVSRWAFAPPDTEVVRPTVRPGGGSVSDVGPGVDFTVGVHDIDSALLAEHIMADWRQGRLWLHAHGFISYTDVFGKSRETCFDLMAFSPTSTLLVRNAYGNQST